MEEMSTLFYLSPRIFFSLLHTLFISWECVNIKSLCRLRDFLDSSCLAKCCKFLCDFNLAALDGWRFDLGLPAALHSLRVFSCSEYATLRSFEKLGNCFFFLFKLGFETSKFCSAEITRVFEHISERAGINSGPWYVLNKSVRTLKVCSCYAFTPDSSHLGLFTIKGW